METNHAPPCGYVHHICPTHQAEKDRALKEHQMYEQLRSLKQTQKSILTFPGLPVKTPVPNGKFNMNCTWRKLCGCTKNISHDEDPHGGYDSDIEDRTLYICIHHRQEQGRLSSEINSLETALRRLE